MNLYIFEMILKFIRMLFIAFISIFNISLYTENENISKNNIVDQDTYAVHTVVLKEEKPAVVTPVKNKTSVVQKQEQVKTITPIKKEVTINNPTPPVQNNETNNKVVTTEAPKVVPKVEENKSIEEFTGRLTGYGPNCKGCSGYGNLACKTRDKKTFSLKNDGIYYTDTEYGKVRILAAATSKFKCGTIVTITKPGHEPFTAVVLDTGGSMRKAWANGEVWMDLAYEDNAMAGSDNLTGKNIKFNIKRYGW